MVLSVLKCSLELEIEDVLTFPLYPARLAHVSLRLGMCDYLQTRTAQHAFYGPAVRYPPIGRIIGIAVLNEVHAWKVRIFKRVHVPELVVLLPLPFLLGTTNHALEEKLS